MDVQRYSVYLILNISTYRQFSKHVDIVNTLHSGTMAWHMHFAAHAPFQINMNK